MDLEDQLISSDGIEDLSKVLSSEDNLFVVIHVSKNPDGSLDYMEYPGIPVVTLINKSLEPQMVYWRCFNSRVEFGLLGPAEGLIIEKLGSRRMVFIGTAMAGAGFVVAIVLGERRPLLLGLPLIVAAIVADGGRHGLSIPLP